MLTQPHLLLKIHAEIHTHLNKLVGLLPVQSVGHTEGVRSVRLVEFAQQLRKTAVDIVLNITGFQALWMKKRYQPWGCLLSLKYNGTRRDGTWLAESAKEIWQNLEKLNSNVAFQIS